MPSQNDNEILLKVERQAQILKTVSGVIENNHNWSFKKELIKVTDYYNPDTGDNKSHECDLLDHELSTWFISQTESRLQDRFASHLIDQLFNLFGPLYARFESWQDDYEYYCQHQKFNNETDIFYTEGHTYESFKRLVERWIYIIRKNIKKFAPELYELHQQQLNELIPIYDEFGDIVDFPNIKSTTQDKQLITKFQWKGDKNELSELIYTLYKSGRIADANTGKPVNRDTLIKAFEELLGVDLKNFDNLLSAKLKTYRARQDGKTFLSELKRYVDERTKGKNE